MSIFTATLSCLTSRKPSKRTLRAYQRSVPPVPIEVNAVNAQENQGYVATEENEREAENNNATNGDEKIYTYDEAIDLAGNGFYSITLMVSMTIVTLSMGVDIFGFSVIVNGASCEFNLGIKETSILLSSTFIGPILMAYPWGYISDTQGRKRSLQISLWSSFLISSASAFSSNWIILAVLKLISTSLSSCGQAASYTLLGECTTRRYRDFYIYIMIAALSFCLSVYVVIGFFILDMEFSYDLGLVTFSPWRLLSLALSFFTGLGAAAVFFVYESPKFLLNLGRHDEALDTLAVIWFKNGGKKAFPVTKLILNEEGNVVSRNISFWKSLWEQLIPIFKPPLLWRSLQLYFLTAVVYSTNNSYFIWLPYLAEQFIKNIGSNRTSEAYLCSMIASSNQTSHSNEGSCSTEIDISLVWFSLVQGFSFVLMIVAIGKIAHRKKLLIICILLASALSGLGAVLIENTTVGFLMLLGLFLNELTIGMIYSYFVDLYPTSFRGMAGCLCTMVARISALSGVKLLGALLEGHCTHSFYISSALILCGVFVALLLPSDKGRPEA